MARKSSLIYLAVMGGVLVLIYLWLAPQIVMLRCLAGDAVAFSAISEAREKVWAFREKHGRLPADLAEAGVPALDLYSYDGDGRGVHRHRRISETELRPGAGREGFKVHFSTYVPGGRVRTASVVGDFNGFDPDKGRMTDSAQTGYGWDYEAEVPLGLHSYRFVIDGREGPLVTAVFDHAMKADGAYPVHPDMPGDEGRWIYDPETGLVVLGCSGVDTKHRRPWHQR